jgi:hypothetical protein
MDPKLVHKLHVVNDVGDKFYEYKGVINVVNRTGVYDLTLKYYGYRSLYVDPDDLNPKRNVWVEQRYHMNVHSPGVFYAPIYETG